MRIIEQKIGTLKYKSITDDQSQIKPFEDQFQIKVIKEAKKTNGKFSKSKKPPSEKKGDDRQVSMLSLPQVIEIYKDRWLERNFDKYIALEVQDTGEEGYDF
jgi:hypothetical protein